ncbi:hypothetical protein FOA43_001298 [Brettanomyces nanus]|uniref:NADH:flavin oxidoreductase/NADH oxidase N-terminal domain-containing protein n=1 Tax=Eeniella nana TaxID=13502 RepID=A0A875S1K5_EENNA|nr:uncharacterized protein FOA43_001298 [Brettanomyces nanus]QPG73982.1 hypothetical protein FOA43_001298 [Brettanomyces nanus]
MPQALNDSNLFRPLKVGHVLLKNRLVHAPATRFRNSDKFVPTDSMLRYYSERAENNGGLIITEASFPTPEFGLFPNTPVIQTSKQVQGWKQIVKSIHDNGSYVAVQLWNLGRAAPAGLLKQYGINYRGVSNNYADEKTENEAIEAGNPLKALTKTELKWMVAEYVSVAERAINIAGFDLIELHAGHSFLIGEFLRESTNERLDEYGGNLENRVRLVLEIVDALIASVGADHIGIKLTPYIEDQDAQGKASSVKTHTYLLEQLQRRAENGNKLAYIALTQPRMAGDTEKEDFNGEDTTWVIKAWKGIIIRTGAFFHDENYLDLKTDVNENDRTLIGAGRYYTSNPDLADRLKNGYPLTPYDRSTFYTAMSNKGYITWPKFGEKEVSNLTEISNSSPKPLV